MNVLFIPSSCVTFYNCNERDKAIRCRAKAVTRSMPFVTRASRRADMTHVCLSINKSEFSTDTSSIVRVLHFMVRTAAAAAAVSCDAISV